MIIKNQIKKIQLNAGELPLELEHISLGDSDVVHVYLHPSCSVYVDGQATESKRVSHGCHLVIKLGKVKR